MAEIGHLSSVGSGNGADGATVIGESAPAKRRPGRPRGAVNKTTRLGKERITEAQPWELLIRVMEGRTFKRAGEEGARRSVGVRPTLEQSIAAAEILLRKVVADIKAVEHSGPDGKPITSETRLSASETVQAAGLAAAKMLGLVTGKVTP